ncbi:MAG: PQQ-dependent sugar dehydrogenase [Pararhodobacter sp.]
MIPFLPSRPASLVAILSSLAAPALPALAADYRAETLAQGLDRPWALAFLPGSSDLIITGRGGALSLWQAETGALQPIGGTPQVDARGQGGLLDVAAAPDHAETRLLYMTWSGANARGHTATHLGRARLDPASASLRDLEVLYVAEPFLNAQGHYGARISFDEDHVFVGFGDRQRKDFGPGHIAQDLSNAYGAVIRLHHDGSLPADNPFVGQEGADGAIWSYGHRNIQAMAHHPETGALWLAEHGESGGDEINIVERGGNYGWPLASFGVDYRSGRAFAPPHQPGDGFVAPVHHWPAGRADNFPPSGMVFYTGAAFPDWQGHLLIGNLRHQYLGLFAVDGAQVTPVARLLDGAGWRIRDVAVGPDDGFLYVIGDGPGAPLLRLVPAN